MVEEHRGPRGLGHQGIQECNHPATAIKRASFIGSDSICQTSPGSLIIGEALAMRVDSRPPSRSSRRDSPQPGLFYQLLIRVDRVRRTGELEVLFCGSDQTPIVGRGGPGSITIRKSACRGLWPRVGLVQVVNPTLGDRAGP
jgi:hypothetical protein